MRAVSGDVIGIVNGAHHVAILRCRAEAGGGQQPLENGPLGRRVETIERPAVLALVVRAPWSDLPDLLADPAIRQALRLSLLAGACATGLSLVFGVLLIIQFIHPEKNDSGATPGDIEGKYSVPDEVMSVLKPACYDCHSAASILVD